MYSVQKSETQKNVNTTVKEKEILIGIHLCMGLHQMPGNRAYWGNDTRCPMVADNMSSNRFQTLLASLHFTDNNDSSNRQAGVKCWKILPCLIFFANNAWLSPRLSSQKSNNFYICCGKENKLIKTENKK